MSGQRQTLAEKLSGVKVGNEVEPGKRTVQRQSAGQRVPAAPEHPAAAVALPDGTAPVEEIVRACTARIFEARRVYEQQKGAARDVYFRWAGPAIRLMHVTKSFKSIEDPDTPGEPYRSFRKWCADQGVSRSHAYRMLDEGPVAAALTPLYQGQFDSSQIEVLAPLVRQHGVERTRQVWSVAAELGATDARGLRVARNQLGYGVTPEDDEPPTPETAISASEKTAGKRTASPTLRLSADRFDADAVREFARERPDLMRLIIAAGQEAIKELEAGE